MISNFRDYIHFPGSMLDGPEIEALAKVDETSGFWIFQKTVAREVFKKRVSVYWQFLDDGKFTPYHDVERLAAAYKAKEMRRKLQA